MPCNRSEKSIFQFVTLQGYNDYWLHDLLPQEMVKSPDHSHASAVDGIEHGEEDVASVSARNPLHMVFEILI